MTVGAKLPWYVKLSLKLMLARVPLPHKMWHRLGIFKHGKMQDFAYAQSVFTTHLMHAGLLEKEKNADKVMLELGPGESLFSAVLARAYGFQSALLVDVGTFALPELGVYQAFARWLANQGLIDPRIDACPTMTAMLTALNAQYLTNGLEALKRLPDNSVDFIFSQAVLEHIRKNEFVETIKELARILKPGGISTHNVDFKDHLEASLNNLRFSEQLWEAEWMASSGFYTNRIRFGTMLQIFEKQDLETTVVEKKEWQTIPLNKKRLHPQFRSIPDADLRVSEATIMLRKKTT
jgi:predicted SAM-dependent methyltransferase